MRRTCMRSRLIRVRAEAIRRHRQARLQADGLVHRMHVGQQLPPPRAVGHPQHQLGRRLAARSKGGEEGLAVGFQFFRGGSRHGQAAAQIDATEPVLDAGALPLLALAPLPFLGQPQAGDGGGAASGSVAVEDFLRRRIAHLFHTALLGLAPLGSRAIRAGLDFRLLTLDFRLF